MLVEKKEGTEKGEAERFFLFFLFLKPTKFDASLCETRRDHDLEDRPSRAPTSPFCVPTGGERKKERKKERERDPIELVRTIRMHYVIDGFRFLSPYLVEPGYMCNPHTRVIFLKSKVAVGGRYLFFQSTSASRIKDLGWIESAEYLNITFESGIGRVILRHDCNSSSGFKETR